VEPTPPATAESPAVEVPAEGVKPKPIAPAQPAPSAPVAAPPAAIAPAPTETQCPECDRDKEPEGVASFLIGPGWFDLSGLNDRLAAQGYERISQPLTVIGGQGHAIFNSGVVMGGMGAGVLGPSGDGPSGVRTQFGGGFGMGEFGFALVHSQAVLFTVTGGVGWYGWSLSIDEPGSTSFDSALENPRRGTTLNRDGLLLGAAVSFEGRVSIGKPERGRQGFLSLGVRAGGLYGPPISDWTLSDGSEATSGPDDAMAGFYAAVTVGFGGRCVAR
jgi:hypothetical protein